MTGAARRSHCAGSGELLEDDFDDAANVGQLPLILARSLEVPDFREAADIARFAHGGGNEGLDDSLRILRRHQRRPKPEDIGAVVLSRVTRERTVGAHSGPYAIDLVRRDCRAQPGAVDDDARLRLTTRDQPRNMSRDIGIVDWIRAVAANVVDRKTLAAKHVSEDRLQGDTRMVTPDRNTTNIGSRCEACQLVAHDVTDNGHAPGA
jgi:hypothetical protein